MNQSILRNSQESSKALEEMPTAGRSETATRLSLALSPGRVSRWSESGMKRLFDSICVLPALPLLVLVFAIIGLAIRLTSRGPVLFLQKRMGRHRRTFTILKFRTMEQSENCRHNCVTTSENQRFTPD